MKLWKRLLIAFLVLVLNVASASVITIFVPGLLPKEEVPDFHFKQGEKPYFEGEEIKLGNVIIPADNDLDAHKQLAYNLYAIANLKYQSVNKAALYTDCVNTTILLGKEVDVNDYRFTVKDGDKYFYSEYSIAADKTGESVFNLFAAENTLYAIRKYTDSTMNDAYCEKIVVPTPTQIRYSDIEGMIASGELPADTCVPLERHIFGVDWTSEDLRVYSEKTPTYYDGQEESYYATDQNILPETIKTAKVTYNEKEHYYTLQLELDVNNPKTTEKTLSNLRQGFGNDTAVYTKMVETIEIWDNGYFKRLYSEDTWEGTNVIKMGFVLRFDTSYYYDEESTQISSYQYASDLLGKLNSAK